ncbi:hypothetical protein NE237_024829 [Protea cynaroides]|uniref:Uncharacterized protein n=1 Tax=Protea cynaroides TaxID=273540 RepID=A0A9Q0H196_9MAGN|nr:hypothetical protein NE237_024829 [Protea cynaroides]
MFIPENHGTFGPALTSAVASITIRLLQARTSVGTENRLMAEPKPDQNVSHSEKNEKAPNLIERAKERIEAIMHTEKSPHHHKETHGTSDDIDENTPISEVKGPNVFERAKEEIEAVVQAIHPKKESDSEKSPHHYRETHGSSDDIDENTPISEVKGPNVFERAKEEIEAVVQAIHPKKESDRHNPTSKKEG